MLLQPTTGRLDSRRLQEKKMRRSWRACCLIPLLSARLGSTCPMRLEVLSCRQGWIFMLMLCEDSVKCASAWRRQRSPAGHGRGRKSFATPRWPQKGDFAHVPDRNRLLGHYDVSSAKMGGCCGRRGEKGELRVCPSLEGLAHGAGHGLWSTGTRLSISTISAFYVLAVVVVLLLSRNC